MSKSQNCWVPKKVNYQFEEGKKPSKRQSVRFSDHHPLKPIIVTESSAVRSSRRKHSDASSVKSTSSSQSSEASNFIDPLSALGETDPLSALSVQETKPQEPLETKISPEYDGDFEHWNVRKMKILAKFTLDEKLSNEMISIAKNIGKDSSRSPYHSSYSIEEKLRSRLSQLDDFAEGSIKEMKCQHQQDFIKKMREFGFNLRQAWQQNQKVNALKIAIQCAKMLADTSVMLYYPSRFVLIADILSAFGGFVFNRILSMCGGMTADQIEPEKVPESAREICANWMLKIASIRELLPRIYIEASILPCYNFLKRGECNSVLVRLTNATRGVGNPLVAVYTRAYLCMVGVAHAPNFKGHLATNFYDFLATYKQIHTTAVQNEIAHQRLDMPTYLSMYSPALEWILSCLAHNAHESTLKDVLEKCVKTGSSLLLLQCVLASFKPDYISGRCIELSGIISDSDDSLFSKTKVYQTFGEKVLASDPPEQSKLPLLNEVWKHIIKVQDPKEYIACAEVWSEYTVKHFKKKEVNTVLGDVIKHMVPDRAFEKHYNKLRSIVQKMLMHMKDFSSVFSMDKFLPFLDMFQKDDVKVDVCKCIGEFFVKGKDSTTSDPLVINGLMYLCKAMHDSINSLSLEGKRKSVSDVICGVIRKVTFGRDFEQQLSFYVECRASFRNLDQVLACLVHLVNSLSVKATKIVKRNHTAKTAAFVRACSAYCFITIPSLNDVYLRLCLYLESGQSSLISHCITQADAIFAASITQLLEMPLHTSSLDGKNVQYQTVITSYISNLMSMLLTMPDHPEQGTLYLLRGLVNVVSGITEKMNKLSKESSVAIYIKVLGLLTAFSQDQYLYRVDDVDSNENLYSSDEQFLIEIATFGTMILDEVLSFISTEGSKSSAALQLFSTIVGQSDLNNASMQNLAKSAWSVASSNQGNTKIMAKLIASMRSKGGADAELALRLTEAS